MAKAKITLENDTLIYSSKYHAGLVAALKAAIPASDRHWDAGRKVWLVAPSHGQVLADLTHRFLGEVVSVPQSFPSVKTETRIISVRYIGQTKVRGTGEPTAFGWANGGWSVVFPEKVLREWFSAEQRPGETPTLYAALGVPAKAQEAEIRSAYRRLAKQWHPDTTQEPDAVEQFRRIQHAYELLQDPHKRARYDAGLTLMSLTKEPKQSPMTANYRSPLRCGTIMAEGQNTLGGRFVVSKIQMWQDITDDAGRLLVSSWPPDADEPLEQWTSTTPC